MSVVIVLLFEQTSKRSGVLWLHIINISSVSGILRQTHAHTNLNLPCLAVPVTAGERMDAHWALTIACINKLNYYWNIKWKRIIRIRTLHRRCRAKLFCLHRPPDSQCNFCYSNLLPDQKLLTFNSNRLQFHFSFRFRWDILSWNFCVCSPVILWKMGKPFAQRYKSYKSCKLNSYDSDWNPWEKFANVDVTKVKSGPIELPANVIIFVSSLHSLPYACRNRACQLMRIRNNSISSCGSSFMQLMMRIQIVEY